jgi:hypothetical protein
MHYKYSSIQNIVFITMMFGAGLPRLFPIAAVSFIVLYLLEKYMLYYVYKSPPAYDEKLNNSVLSNLSFSPLLLLSFGYWMFSNKQLLQRYDELQPIAKSSITFNAEHYWHECITPAGILESGPAGILLASFYLYLAYLVFRNPISYIANKCCRGMFVK